MKRLVTLERALTDKGLLALGERSWLTWRSVLKAAYAEPLSNEERSAFDLVSGGRPPPRRKVKELVAGVSRRAGKGRVAGALAAYETSLIDHSARLAPGEVGVVACISPTREQARIVQRYALGFFEASLVLRNEVAEMAADEIRLRNGNVICTLASDYRTLRGRTLLLAILDEASFLKDESSRASDLEAARALLPGLATTHGMLVILSSPYRRNGLLFQRHRDHFGQDSEDVLCVAGPSLAFNPTLDSTAIEAARQADPQAALSEWDGEFRIDLAAFLDDATIDAAIDHGRPLELPPADGVAYRAFVDASGGVGQDAYTIAITHKEGDLCIVDVVRGTSGKFDPAAVTREYAALLKEYRVTSARGDRYAAEWVGATWRGQGVTYVKSELPKSQIYIECLPLFARGLVRLPAHSKLLRELRLLQRQTHRSGKDSVDHPRSAHDDHANACCGALHLIGAAARGLCSLTCEDWAGILADVRKMPPYRSPPGLSNWQRRHERDIARFR
jgi:hypothetical protein